MAVDPDSSTAVLGVGPQHTSSIRTLPGTNRTGEKDNPADHDTLATADLLGCFLGFDEVTKILVDMRYVGLDFTGFPTFIHDTNHFDHFHVQLADPDGTNN